MLLPHQYPYRVVLGSASPRRKELMERMGFDFEVRVKATDESYPASLPQEEVAEYIAVKKAAAFSFDELPEKALLVTADTVVLLDGHIFGKPADREEAVRMLYTLSGQTHRVITGVCLRSREKQERFSVVSDVTFRVLSLEEIEYYVDKLQPYDKAGAYGLQEWIGYVAVEKVEGSFFNVMGLPTQRLYRAMMAF
ncbi:MAG: Maf-like protein [Bacteroidales bacterium]|nr:Maf-like protein [Bacteroidales bacterium]MDE7091175.1 Maf-like protein [Bacteroidales bacterium]MDE7103883.1 Maf-like protein [Bacteroidales bacterium]